MLVFRPPLIFLSLFFPYFTAPTLTLAATPAPRPRLIVAIVMDQFRADYLTRFESRFLPARTQKGELGGFEYLKSQGAYFPQGQYDILQSMTAPGHTTVLTGSYPYQSGIPLNEWYDAQTQKKVYCTDDPGSQLVGSTPSKSKRGVSPLNLIATTVGDELKNAGFPSRVISIALKDRAAVLMGGHRADLALWFDTSSNQWVSSQYYLTQGKLPEWVDALNQTLAPPLGTTFEWKSTRAESGNSAVSGMPHTLRIVGEGVFGSPIGLSLTEAAAEHAVHALHLGKARSTDLLAVSFSSHDVIGHAYGPNSREMEEMTIAEDRVLSRFLNFLNRSVPGGLKNIVIAFTGDHGVAPQPEWAITQRIKAGRIDDEELGQLLSDYLNKKFGKPTAGQWISQVMGFNFYYNWPALQNKKIETSDIDAESKSFLTKTPGVAFVVTSTDYHNRKLPPGMHERQILHTYYPGRSGDLILIPKPFYIPGSAGNSNSTHITGYSYDRTVPIIISGFHIKRGTYSNRAEVIDIAPTLSFLTGTVPPSLSEGRVLSEIISPLP